MKDAYTISYAPQALEDLKGIYAYIAFELQASVTAKKLVNQIRKEIRSLDHMPLYMAGETLCASWKRMPLIESRK